MSVVEEIADYCRAALCDPPEVQTVRCQEYLATILDKINENEKE